MVPVPRSELLGSLQRGSTCQFDKDTFQWTFRFEAGAGKTKAPTLLRLPVTSNGMMRAWLKYYRPVLLKVCRSSSLPCVDACSLALFGMCSDARARVRVPSEVGQRASHRLRGADTRAPGQTHWQIGMFLSRFLLATPPVPM